MKKYLVVFVKQPAEFTNAYSLVDDEILATIPLRIIQTFKEVEDRLYFSAELEKMRDEMI